MNKYANENFNEQMLNNSYSAEKSIRVLKHNETFGIFDRYGDIIKRDDGEQGLYHAGTRYLSRCEFSISGKKPLLLSSFITQDNAILMVDMTNPAINDGKTPSGAIHILRSIFIWHAARYEFFSFCNYLDEPLRLNLDMKIEADYFDIFEVRGHKRHRRGQMQEAKITDGTLTLGYTGLDDVARYTHLSTVPQPSTLHTEGLSIAIELPARGAAVAELSFSVGLDEASCSKTKSFAESYGLAQSEGTKNRADNAAVSTSNEQFNDLINRSLADIHLLVTATEKGPYPYAGVPWFSAPFGRDGIITALEMLWVNPELAKTVLHFLAATQGTELDEKNDCEPGKIIHEARQGEMANLGEIPFKKYYGSVDSTPLFILLAGAYFKRTADLAFIKVIWPNIKSALNWIDEYGDSDHDGFIEYNRHSPNGLVHQGWKDSENAVFHADGSLAEAPIALCEVQGYLYLALKSASTLAKALDENELAEQLNKRKDQLKEKFQKDFWQKDLGFYALALDKYKKPCRVKSSNVGHCLYTGIIEGQHAAQVVETLMSPEMFSGWGVRTIGENEALYNPMSYHNGTIWPHDCAIAGAGMARYGFKDHCLKVMTGLFDASNLVDFHRLPELFCGFTRGPGKSPTIYPMSCAPQAWAAGSIFLLLGYSLGIKVRAAANEVIFYRPRLPTYLDSVTIKNLTINGKNKLDLNFVNYGDNVGVDILKREGDSKVIVIH